MIVGVNVTRDLITIDVLDPGPASREAYIRGFRAGQDAIDCKIATDHRTPWAQGFLDGYRVRGNVRAFV